jgi:peroxiredoxin
MKYRAGDIFPSMMVTTSRGIALNLPVADAALTHIQFRRFSGCPICNVHIASLRKAKPELDALGIHEVLFFHSSQDDVANFHDDIPFDAVGDRQKRYYREFGVESSLRAFLSLGAFGAAFSGILRGMVGLKMTGGPLGLPAEFLIGPDGRIKAAHYGKHAYDQWPVETLISLARDPRPVIT